MDDVLTPFHVTAGYLGQPGNRTFFLQWEDEGGLESVLCEKGQVDRLADVLERLLAELDDTLATDWDREAMDLREPVKPRWRLGLVGVGVDVESARIVLELSELTDADDEPVEQVRMWLDRDLARRLGAQAREVVGEGRPTCELCGRPTALSGEHVCPSTNGYGRLTR